MAMPVSGATMSQMNAGHALRDAFDRWRAKSCRGKRADASCQRGVVQFLKIAGVADTCGTER